MKRISKVEIDVDGRIIDVKELGNGRYQFIIEEEVPEREPIDPNMIVLIEASKLSLEDTFMKHVPKNPLEEKFKSSLEDVIKKGIEDFYKPICDPSFSKDGISVTFKCGEKPALGKSYDWWEKAAKEFMPERESRLGTKAEYLAFLGVLIKKLIEDKKWSVAKAWDAVCVNSKNLGHYHNSKCAKEFFEDTGEREVCGFFDLANTCKIVAIDNEERFATGFWLAAGRYNNYGGSFPLSSHIYCTYRNVERPYAVGWIVLPK